MKLGVVWFKRDLRVFDHAPLVEAAKHRQVLPLYIYEPPLIRAPDYATQHIGFINECLVDLDQALSARGSPLLAQYGEATAIFQRVLDTFGPFALYSHEETGNALSYERDKRVAEWCRANGIVWKEFPSNGVVRKLSSRDEWSDLWMQRMKPPPLAAPDFLGKPEGTLTPNGIMLPHWMGMPDNDKPLRQKGGRKQAAQLLKQFLSQRLSHYRFGMSSPLSAADLCSRLSPHIAYGSLSIKELVHKVWKTRAELNAMPAHVRPKGAVEGLKSFESRLHWRCHFVQKLESEPEIETRNMHRGFDGLREPHFNREYFERWRKAETGFPLIDACMRMLAETGWINFRMRALLVSFSSYQLWNHWREPALHLAQEFLDYEPGIHYSQIQMQSGVTGINTLRIYNPVKQAQDHDPQGVFVRRWLPAMRRVPDTWLFEPWRMPLSVQQQCGVRVGVDIPQPLVDLAQATREAKARLHARRAEPAVKAAQAGVVERHASRRQLGPGGASRQTEWRGAPKDSPQLGLDFGD